MVPGKDRCKGNQPFLPKAVDRARDRFRQSGAKDDRFDARVLAGFLRTDHAHLMVPEPSSEAAQGLRLLTEDCQRQVRTQTRLMNQLTATLKAYYPRALEVAELTTALASAFLQAYPTPAMLMTLGERQWQRWAKAHHLSAVRTMEVWTSLKAPQLPVPPHVVRAKSRLMQALVTDLAAVVAAASYRQAIDDVFASMPPAAWARTLPVGEHGVTVTGQRVERFGFVELHRALELGRPNTRPWLLGSTTMPSSDQRSSGATWVAKRSRLRIIRSVEIWPPGLGSTTMPSS